MQFRLFKSTKSRISPLCAVGGSVQGASHKRKGVVNQDHALEWTEGVKGVGIVAVADGHGSSLHFRSNIGSEAATTAAVAVLRDIVTQNMPKGNVQAVLDDIINTRLGKAIHHDWMRRVAAHHRENPFCDCELGELTAEDEAKVSKSPELAFGTTLLAAAFGPEYGVAVRIGDGTVVAVDSSGESFRPFEEDDSTGSESSHSLCQSSAVDFIETVHFQYAVDKPKCIAISTDGYTKSFASHEEFIEGLTAFYNHAKAHGESAFRRELIPTLESITTDGSGDDTSVGLLYWN